MPPVVEKSYNTAHVTSEQLALINVLYKPLETRGHFLSIYQNWHNFNSRIKIYWMELRSKYIDQNGSNLKGNDVKLSNSSKRASWQSLYIVFQLLKSKMYKKKMEEVSLKRLKYCPVFGWWQSIFFIVF